MVKIIPGLSQKEIEAYIKKLAEVERQQMEQREKLRHEYAMAQANAKAELDRIVRLEKEQERQAAQLAKHEERLLRLEQRMALAEREIAHYKPMLEELRKQETDLDNKVWYYEQRGLPCSGVKKELEKMREKAYRIETKVFKAQQDIDFCARQMGA